MVKTTVRWFAKPVERLERVDPMDVAILALCGTKHGNETSGLGRKIAVSLISSKNQYILQVFKDYICGCCRMRVG